MSPHNAARHALIPTTGSMQLLGMDAKARRLCDALHGLDQKATPIMANVIDLLKSKTKVRRVCSKDSWAIVNATASLAVRQALASTELLTTRVIETSLFAGGIVGMITTEGPGRNPNTADLIAEYYGLVREDPDLAHIVFGSDDVMSRQNIGQGCGSLTMTMSDGRLSLFAAGMSEYLLSKQSDGLPCAGGEILIGRLSADGIGLEWCVHQSFASDNREYNKRRKMARSHSSTCSGEDSERKEHATRRSRQVAYLWAEFRRRPKLLMLLTFWMRQRIAHDRQLNLFLVPKD